MSPSRVQLTKNFRIEEFDCRNGARVPTAAVPALRRWCQLIGEPLRDRFGPVRVTSGYRTTDYNRSVGGAPASYHVYDRRHPAGTTVVNPYDLAADVVPARGTPAQWEQWARARFRSATWTPGRGRGAAVAYPSSGFVHLDTGPARTWAG